MGALATVLGQVLVKKMRAFGLATVAFTLGAIILELSQNGASAWVEPGMILAGASLFPQLHAIVRSRPYRNVLGVTGTLLWCAAALHTWTFVDPAQVSQSDIISGVLLTSCLGFVSIGFAETAAGLLRVGQGKLWLAVSIALTILVSIAPWAGDTSGVPIALSNAGSTFGDPVTITLLYRDMNLSAPIEVTTLAAGEGYGLGLLRMLLLYTALVNGIVLALVAITEEEALKKTLHLLTIATAVLAASIPLLSLFSFLQEPTVPQEVFELAIDRLGFASGNAAVDLGIGTSTPLNMHPLGMSPSTALLAGLSGSLFVGLGQTREPTIFEDSNPGLGWSMAATLSMGLTLVWAQWAIKTDGAGFGIDRAPWITVLAALLFVTGTAFTARMGKSSSRLTALGHMLAFAALIVGIIGPGEGWTA
jgi:hypothetical protein